MVELNTGPAFPDFAKSASEDQVKDIFHKVLLQNKLTLLRSFFTVFLFLTAATQSVQARHKCPKVPAPPGLMGIFSSSSLLPSGSTMAAARSSETLGCENGHPSENFYKPKDKLVALFLKDNLTQISQESAQGHGQHLNALASLAGCTNGHDVFAEIIQQNYNKLFNYGNVNLTHELSFTSADQTSDILLNLISDSPLLASACKSS